MKNDGWTSILDCDMQWDELLEENGESIQYEYMVTGTGRPLSQNRRNNQLHHQIHSQRWSCRSISGSGRTFLPLTRSSLRWIELPKSERNASGCSVGAGGCCCCVSGPGCFFDVVRFSLLRLGFLLASSFVSIERTATQEPTNFSSRIQQIGTVQRIGTLSGIPNGCGEPPRQSAH